MKSENIVRMPGVTRTDRPADGQPQADVIAVIERLLEQAKAGEVQAVAVAKVYADGCVGEHWGGDFGRNMWLLMAALSVLQHRYLAECTALPPTPDDGPA